MHEPRPSRTGTEPPFIDRQREKGILFEQLTLARAGQGGLVLLEGEAGVGKTRLLAQVRNEGVEKGFRCIVGKCLEYRKTPYFPFVEMLKEYFRVVPEWSHKENTEAIRETIIRNHPSLLPYLAPLSDLFIPRNEPLGSYRIAPDIFLEAVSDLKKRGFRTLVVSGAATDPGLLDLFESGDRLTMDLDDGKGISPKRLERLAKRVRDIYSKARHCAIVHCSLDTILEHNRKEKVESLFRIFDQLSRNHGGVSLVLVPGERPLGLETIDGFEPYERYLGLDHKRSQGMGQNGSSPLLSTYELISNLFLEMAREQPLLMVLEDLQWGDKATLNLLQYLARTARKERMLILGSFRSEEIALEDVSIETPLNPLKDALQRISREKLYNIVQIGRFDKAHTGQLLEALMGHPPEMQLLDQVFIRTEGNPMFIIELWKVLKNGDGASTEGHSPLPTSAEDLVQKRLGTLDPKAKEVLKLVSVLSGATRLEIISSMSGIAEEELLDVIDTLNELKFLKETDVGIVFEHNKVREAVYSLIPPEERKVIHLMIAGWMEGQSERMDLAAKGLLADHYFMGGRYKDALEIYISSSEHSMERSFMDQAQKEIERALKCLENMEGSRENSVKEIGLVQSLGDIRQRRGELDEALACYRKAIGISERQSITFGLASSYRRIGDVKLRLFDWDQTIDNYLRSLHLSKKMDDQSEVAMAFKGMGKLYYMKGDYARSLECYLRYLEYPDGRKTSTYVQGLQEIGDIYHEMGDFNQALTYYKLSIRTGEEREIYQETAHSYIKMAEVLLRLGDVDDARRFSDWAFSIVREHLGDETTVKVMLRFVEMMLEFGDMEKAEEGVSLIPGGLQGSCMDRLTDATMARLNALLLARKRDFASSNSEMERASKALQEIQVPFQLGLSYFQNGLIRFQCMEVEKARELLGRASEVFKALRSLNYMSRTASKLREVTFIMEGLKR